MKPSPVLAPVIAIARRRGLALLLSVLLLLAAVVWRAEPAHSSHPGSGYWMLTADGHVYNFGGAAALGEPAEHDNLHVDIETTPSGHGFWVLRAGGTVTHFGDAAELASGPKLPSGERYVSLSATPKGDGYWLFTNRGAVHPVGAAPALGDMSKVALNSPVIDSVATPSGKGYWLVAGDGGIFSFGDATFFGSMGGTPLNQPVISMAPDPDGRGYWLVAGDGGIFAFDAPFVGSMGSTRLNKPVSGMVGGDGGYLMVAEDGGIFAFGAVDFHGSLGADPPDSKVVSVAVIGKPKPLVILPPDPAPTTTTTTTTPTTTTTGPDTTAPNTTITAPSDGALVGPIFVATFTSTESGSTFECSIDSDPFTACSSGDLLGPQTHGFHTLEVRATDASDNVDASPASVEFQVDAQGPTVTITAPADGGSVPTISALDFTADPDATDFECQVDGGSPFPCTSGWVLDLSPGVHTATVQATDTFGNSGSDSTTFTVV